MAEALNAWAQQAGLQLIWPAGDPAGQLMSPRVVGEFEPQQALRMLLQGSGLTYSFVDGRTVAIRPQDERRSQRVAWLNGESHQAPEHGSEIVARLAASSSGPAQQEGAKSGSESQRTPKTNKVELEEVVVTGTNIKGVAPAGSPIIVLDEQTIRRSGYTSTEQVIQSLPQNIRSGAAGAAADSGLSTGSIASANVTHGSGANLRGLGSNATLTLINGRRTAPSSQGTLTDISLIPIDAIERIEVLTGASAIYGADAVAGVINVILKNGYDGSETRVRYGLTAPSGRDEIRVSQALGGNWGGGSGLAILDYMNQTELSVSERNFTSDVTRPTTIYPDNKQIGIVLSGAQKFGEKWSAQGDAQYARVKRHSEDANSEGVYQYPVEINRTNVALSLIYAPVADWDISLDGQVSKEDDDFSQLLFRPGITAPDVTSQVQNLVQKQWSAGLKATGTLFDLPAGRMGIALGAVHRSEDYQRKQLSPSLGREPAQREVDSAFAEIHFPLFGLENSKVGLQRLDLSLAGRYDDYSDFGDTVNPKIGLSWVPIGGLELRASYSTSFRAPAAGTELFTSSTGTQTTVPIVSFATVDGTGTLPVVVVSGSRVLQAEEAKNWTAGFTYRPEAVAGLQIGFTYYDISYTNRIVKAPFDQGGLSNPALQTFFTVYNSSAELQAAVAQMTHGTPSYLDITGAEFNGGEFGSTPQNVATYLFDFRFLNAGVVNTSGADVTVDYSTELMGGALNLALNANRIAKIDTIFAPGAPTFDFVDTTGNPASLRLRTSAAYTRGKWDAAFAVNYTDKYTDTSGVIDTGVDAYITVDGNLRYTLQNLASPALENLSIALSVTNLFNESPPFVQASGQGSHYDGANADPLGRLIAIEVAKRW
jgi:outer membrane receptor protein involved in Fe transport